MLARRYISWCKSSLALLALVSSGMTTAFANEPAEKKAPEKQTKPAPKPGKSEDDKGLLEFRAYRPADSIFHNDVSAPPNIAIPRPSAPPPRLSRRQLERIDREKNWIFLSPEDYRTGESPEEIFGVDRFLDGKEHKSLLNRFLDNDPAASPGRELDALKKPEPLTLPQFSGFQNPNPISTQPGFDSERAQELFGDRVPMSGNRGSLQPMSLPQFQKSQEVRRSKIADFESLFKPQTDLPGVNVSGVPDTNPQGRSGDSSFESLMNTRPNLPRTSEPINPLPRPGQQSSLFPETGANNRLFTPNNTTTLPNTPPPRDVSQPAVLPIPRRQF